MKLSDVVLYHLYPLGALGALRGPRGPHRDPPLARLADWIPALQRIGANALLLGPVFESERHGYDIVDLRSVDRRLGTDADLVTLSKRLRDQGIALVLDAVFNHVGRSHRIVSEAAARVVGRGPSSPGEGWIAGFDPSRRGPGGLPFAYEGWKGHYSLVKLDTGRQEVREYLIQTTLGWIEALGVAGLRLDAADCLDHGFLRELSQRCRARDPEFFLIGEAVHGDHYRPLLDAGLDAVTNYEAYKSLWSSYNDRNQHEIAWTLDRLFGESGLCRGRLLQTFADNHDVDRVASVLRDPAGLYPLYGLLFAMPGIPSVYYGSEVGLGGRRLPRDDEPLRPALDPGALASVAPQPDLPRAIARFAEARKACRAVREGSYRRLHVEMEGLVFLRQATDALAIVAVNASPAPLRFSLQAPEAAGRVLRDRLDPGHRTAVSPEGALSVEVPPHWLRWLAPSVG